MKVSQYLAELESVGRFISIMPCGSTVSGTGYDVGKFDDGAVLRVGDRIVYAIQEPVGYGIVDQLAKVGRLLAGLSRPVRAAQLSELGRGVNGRHNLDGTLWDDAGEFLGLEGFAPAGWDHVSV